MYWNLLMTGNTLAAIEGPLKRALGRGVSMGGRRREHETRIRDSCIPALSNAGGTGGSAGELVYWRNGRGLKQGSDPWRNRDGNEYADGCHQHIRYERNRNLQFSGSASGHLQTNSGTAGVSALHVQRRSTQ